MERYGISTNVEKYPFFLFNREQMQPDSLQPVGNLGRGLKSKRRKLLHLNRVFPARRTCQAHILNNPRLRRTELHK